MVNTMREDNEQNSSRNSKEKITGNTNKEITNTIKNKNQEEIAKRIRNSVENPIIIDKREVKFEELNAVKDGIRSHIKRISITSKNVVEKSQPQIVIVVKENGLINIKINPYKYYEDHFYLAENLTEQEYKDHAHIFDRITRNKLVEDCGDILPAHKFRRTNYEDMISRSI